MMVDKKQFYPINRERKKIFYRLLIRYEKIDQETHHVW